MSRCMFVDVKEKSTMLWKWGLRQETIVLGFADPDFVGISMGLTDCVP